MIAKVIQPNKTKSTNSNKLKIRYIKPTRSLKKLKGGRKRKRMLK